jgi:hypothetical protein
MDPDRKSEIDRLTREINEILRRVDALPLLDFRSEDEILGYDENGLPS